MHASHALLLLLLLALPTFVPILATWPWYLAGPILTYYLLVFLIKPLRQTTLPLSVGTFDRLSLFATVAIAVIASLTLVAWYYLLRPNLPAHSDRLPNWLPGHWIWTAILFAALNATLEEVIFRGILFAALTMELGLARGIFAQAALFSIAHFQGVPGGLLGSTLAACFGLMLGWLRRPKPRIGATNSRAYMCRLNGFSLANASSLIRPFSHIMPSVHF